MDWRSKRTSISFGSFKPSYQDYGYDTYKTTGPQLPLPQVPVSQAIRSGYYETHWPLYGFEWTHSDDTECIAVSTFKEDSTNKLQVIHGQHAITDYPNGMQSSGFDFYRVAEATLHYPVTKLQWDPGFGSGSSPERLATASDSLRIWELDGTLNEVINLSNMKQHSTNSSTYPPVTSLDWNAVNTNVLLSCSIDTTCTAWDLATGTVKTQLIAHDSEVFDVKFVKGSVDVFASVGNDGSMRMFDLRSLEHSTILYEPPSTQAIGSAPLVRLETSPVNSNLIATIGHNSHEIIIIDVRNAGIPTLVLDAHQAPVNSIKWHPTKEMLVSGSDDCQALIWDIGQGNFTPSLTWRSTQSQLPVKTCAPSFMHVEAMEINNVDWSPMGDWFGSVSGKGFQVVKTFD